MNTSRLLRWVFLGCLPAAGLLATAGAAEPAGGADADTYAFKRGVNISHWLSQNNAQQPYAAGWFTEADVAWIAAHHFDHIRLPVDVRTCLKPDGSLDPAKLQPIHAALGWAISHHLGMVLDAHFLPGADFNSVGGDKRAFTDPQLEAKDAGVWRQLAREFANEGPALRFEILNEPVATENRQLNPFMRDMRAAIRESNPTRVVYITSNKWSSFAAVPDVEIPKDPNVALTIHFYEPLAFTHQRAPWVGFKDSLPPITFPGRVPSLKGHTLPHFRKNIHEGDVLTVAQVDQAFARVSDWLKVHAPGIEVYVGEFGVFHAADPVSTQRWIRTVVRNCESRGWGWAVWEYEGSFGVRGPDGRGTPVLAALFTP